MVNYNDFQMLNQILIPEIKKKNLVKKVHLLLYNSGVGIIRSV